MSTTRGKYIVFSNNIYNSSIKNAVRPMVGRQRSIKKGNKIQDVQRNVRQPDPYQLKIQEAKRWREIVL